MLLLGALLLLAQVAFGIHPKPLSSLQQSERNYPTDAPTPSTTPAPSSNDDDDDDDLMPNGFPVLSPKTKALIEQCIIDDYIDEELSCGNNPYSGILRLSFHDCGTFDKTNTSYPGGCNAWMSKQCDELDECEYTAHENNGLQPWVKTLDAMYDNAQLNGKKLSHYLSRADLWHLAAHYALEQSSAGNLNLTYYSGRIDPDMSGPGPRFVDRLPGATSFSEMQRVCYRNGMNDFNAAALLGAHTLGNAHPNTSGYQGAWDPTPFTFDEQYWKGLLNLEWQLHPITSVNSETGETVNTLQYSLPGVNYGVSVMLFADIGQIVNTTDECPTVNDPNNSCPSAMPNLQKALNAWANNASTFYSAFKKAYDPMSQWGCTGCTPVAEYTGRIYCGMNGYWHNCHKIYKTPYYMWKSSGSGSGRSYTTTPPTTTRSYTTPSPTTTTTPAPTTTTPAPTTTTPAPTTTTCAPTTTTPAPTTTTPAPTTTTPTPTHGKY